jgi:hypothetical protein
MKKLIAYITKDIQEEVNSWIEENIPNAGPDNFSTPFFLFPESEEVEQEFDEYVTSWRLDPEPLEKLLNYLSTNHKDKFRYSMVQVRHELEQIEKDKEEKKKENPERALEILSKQKTELEKDKVFNKREIALLKEEKTRLEGFNK